MCPTGSESQPSSWLAENGPKELELALRVTSLAESAKELVFSFFEGQLFGSAVSYDQDGTEGLPEDDFVQAASATYGAAQYLPL